MIFDMVEDERGGSKEAREEQWKSTVKSLFPERTNFDRIGVASFTGVESRRITSGAAAFLSHPLILKQLKLLVPKGGKVKDRKGDDGAGAGKSSNSKAVSDKPDADKSSASPRPAVEMVNKS